MFYAQADEVVEGFNQVNGALFIRACRIHRNLELAVKRLVKMLHRKKRSPAFDVEQIAQQILLLS